MRMRPIIVVSCVLAVATSGVAVAAPKTKPKPKPPCNLVVDKANDLISAGIVDPSLSAASRPYDPALDVVSADIANDANTVTAVIRVAKLTVGDPLAPTGRFYRLAYTMRSTGQGGQLYVQVTPTGTLWQQGAGTGVLDTARNEVRISVPISRLVGHPLFKPGDALEKIVVQTDLAIPAAPADLPTGIGPTFQLLGDSANGPKPYPVGTPTCVKVGS